uniref:Uncharacterized protein n=1 Tax=Amphilophus citrinellus TaxID=61819 RepID=A0A3Q0R6T6_AMPCI
MREVSCRPVRSDDDMLIGAPRCSRMLTFRSRSIPDTCRGDVFLIFQHQNTSNIMINTHKFQHVPVKYIVIREALSVEQVSEELPQIRVIRLVIKAQRATKIQVGGKLSCDKSEDKKQNMFQLIKQVLENLKLTRVALAKHLNRGGHFLLTDTFILLPLGSCFQPLPR